MSIHSQVDSAPEAAKPICGTHIDVGGPRNSDRHKECPTDRDKHREIGGKERDIQSEGGEEGLNAHR